ncbi:hypothetical protein AOB60_06360 [Streptomyces noursei]|uniref:Uncharacterized protein n=1 Tax=Streptomyces noursei TaxID=1971 RepID=A0A2N8PHN3_STRNR|nr:hypothetical protein AOB60_06360 [Streptomyces noursei]
MRFQAAPCARTRARTRRGREWKSPAATAPGTNGSAREDRARSRDIRVRRATAEGAGRSESRWPQGECTRSGCLRRPRRSRCVHR